MPLFSKGRLVNTQIDAILNMALLWPWSECAVQICEDKMLILPQSCDANQSVEPMIIPLRGLQIESVKDMLFLKPLKKEAQGQPQKIVLSAHLPSDIGSPTSGSKFQGVRSAVIGACTPDSCVLIPLTVLAHCTHIYCVHASDVPFSRPFGSQN